jgi:hypothetical protein
MQRLIVWLLSLALTFGSFIAQAAGDARAAELLAQARAALGGEKSLSKVHGLTLAGTAQRMIGDRQVDGELTLDVQLPDKMLRSDSIQPMGDGAFLVTSTGMNGDTLLRASKIIGAPPGVVIRTPPPPAPGSDAEAQGLRNSRAELARLTVVLLLAVPPSMALEFTSEGQAESPDGKADVIDVKGPNGFAAKLFLDATSHVPLMLTYRGVSPRMIVTTQQQRGGTPPDPSAIRRAEAAAQQQAGELVDITMFLDDYKRVDDVLLPHHITRSVDGKPSEEWTFKSIRVNPTFKADTFASK